MVGKDPRVTGTRIARRRQQLGWTQIELAARLGVSPSTVANWERGVSYPKKKLGKVEQVLGVSLDGAPDPEPEPDVMPPGLRESIRRTLPPDRAAVVEAAVEAALRGDPLPTGRPARNAEAG